EPLECSEAKRLAFRHQYGSRYKPEQTVFVDESSFDRCTSIRKRAWALLGQRAVRQCFFFYSTTMIYHCRYSLLPALSLNGIIHAKIVEGSFTTTLFHDFIEGLLDCMQPFPAPNCVIVMDNARIHKTFIPLEAPAVCLDKCLD
ncbi:hypothetical protein L208DRAFT_1232809, partial [Tricholoma matsutake]